MRSLFYLTTLVGLVLLSCKDNNEKSADAATLTTPQVTETTAGQTYFIDVHDLEPGKVVFKDVADAHKKDLATQGKYDVNFIKYWVDEQKGKVYCLSQAKNAESVRNTHKEAHGLMPSEVYQVSDGHEASMTGNQELFIDVHQMGPGKVTAKDVADAHAKDLAVQGQHHVNFINYWVDEKKGVIMCLSEAPDSNAVKAAHKEAHGLIPAYVMRVKQGE